MRLKNKLFLGLLALFLAGCSEHDWVDAASDKPVKVTAQIAKGRVGFSEMDSITYAYWENEDAITLSTPLQGNLDYAASMSVEGTGLVTFSPKGDYLKDIDGEKVFACYPASAITEGKVSLPATDVWTDDNPLPFAYAVSSIKDSEVSLDFKHVFSFLKLNVAPEMLSDTTKAIRYVTVSTDSDVPLSTIEGSVFNFSSVGSISGEDNITVITNTRVVDSNWTVYIPVLPQPAETDITITLADSLGSTLYTLTKQTPETGFLAGNVYRLGNSYGTSYLIDGPTFNASIKELASDVVAGRGTYDADSLIVKVEFLTEVQTLPEKYITVSAADSPAPIYASFNATNSLLTVFTPAKNIEVVDASYMFYNLRRLRTIEFGNFDIDETTTNISYIFGVNYSLTNLDVSGWDTSNVMNMNGTFSNCYSLTSLDLSNWNTEKVTNMSRVFSGCTGLTSLNVSNWNTGNVTDMSFVFAACIGLTSLDLSSWNTENVINMYHIFGWCSGLTSLDLSNWNTENVTNMMNAFGGCSSLTSLDVSNWSINEAADFSDMFSICASTSQSCKITATLETQEYLLSETGTTGMNPAWFIWINGKTEGGSSVENMPNQGW